MSKDKTMCVVCNNWIASSLHMPNKGVVKYQCPICSQFTVSNTMNTVLSHSSNYGDERHIISGFIRNLYDTNNEIFELHESSLDKLLKDGDPRIIVPKNMDDKLNMILFYIKRKTTYPSERITMNNLHDYPICFSKNHHEFTFYLQHLEKLGLLSRLPSDKGGNFCDYYLTVKGFDYIAKLQEFNVHSNRCFVAMWFDKSLDDIYSEAIKPAIEKAKYQPIRIKEESRSNPDVERNIDDRIMAEIKMSRFMVADFTEQRQNVYYEAGFAYGLGMKVIRCCEDCHVDKLHFDSRNRDHLVWEKGKEKEFSEALYDRIIVLLGEGSFKED